MSLSLLWPDARTDAAALSTEAARDLEVDLLAAALSPDGRQRRPIAQLLRALPADPAVITYRQDVLADLLDQPDLLRRLDALLPSLYELAAPLPFLQRNRQPLFEVINRLSELELWVECVVGLASACARAELRAEGWLRLRAAVTAMAAEETFRSLQRELPGMLAALRNVSAVTIGVNLDDRLRPIQAALVGVHAEPFTDASLLDRLFGRSDGRHGLVPLRSNPPAPGGREGQTADGPLTPLFRDLAELLDKVSRPITQTLKRYGGVSSAALVALRDELAFYTAAAQFTHRLRAAGLALCRPEIAPAEARLCQIDGAYSLPLALRRLEAGAPVVPNRVRLDDDGRVAILTGPNGGGKTTYLQTVGLAHLLAQVGLPTPGVWARISPVDQIFTHYQQEEEPERGVGRFGREAERLRTIFEQATPHSLLLLNEALASTSAGEGLYLAQDLVRLLRRLGMRAVYATHLHELAADLDALNAEPGGSRVISLVASPIAPTGAATADDATTTAEARSFRIVVGPPLGRSYARELAAQHGIDYAQLADLLAQRGY